MWLAEASDTVMSMTRALLLLIVLVAGLSACTSSRYEQVVLDDVKIWRSVEAVGGPDAMLSGTIGYEEECGAVIFTGAGSQVTPVVWPAGTELERGVTVRLSDGMLVEPGQFVSGGGSDQPGLDLFPEGCGDPWVFTGITTAPLPLPA